MSLACQTSNPQCNACSVTTPTDCVSCATGYRLDNYGKCISNTLGTGTSSGATLELLMITVMIIALTIMCAVF